MPHASEASGVMRSVPSTPVRGMRGGASGLYSKAGIVATAIAQDLLLRRSGDRIPSVAAYAKQFGVGVNTVQRALALVQANGTTVRSYGRRGSYVDGVNMTGLWSMATNAVLLGLMPLPYSRRYEGLSTGLNDALAALSIPYSIAYMPGSRLRLRALSNGYTFAVISSLVASHASASDIEVVTELPPGSFVASHGVISSRLYRKGPPRVGVDPDSVDQQLLTEAEFGSSAAVVSTKYMQLLPSLRAGLIDAAVWALDSVSADDTIMTSPLRTPAAIAMDRLATSAVVVVRQGESLLGQLLRENLDASDIVRTQQAVLSNARLPIY